jgi:hypothetical protein
MCKEQGIPHFIERPVADSRHAFATLDAYLAATLPAAPTRPLEDNHTMNNAKTTTTTPAPVLISTPLFSSSNLHRHINLSAEMVKELSKAKGSVFLDAGGLAPKRVSRRRVTIAYATAEVTLTVLAPVGLKPSDLRDLVLRQVNGRGLSSLISGTAA